MQIRLAKKEEANSIRDLLYTAWQDTYPNLYSPTFIRQMLEH